MNRIRAARTSRAAPRLWTSIEGREFQAGMEIRSTPCDSGGAARRALILPGPPSPDSRRRREHSARDEASSRAEWSRAQRAFVPPPGCFGGGTGRPGAARSAGRARERARGAGGIASTRAAGAGYAQRGRSMPSIVGWSHTGGETMKMKLTLAAALSAVLAASPSAAQRTIAQGMSPGQVRSTFGAPARTRTEGDWTYWFYSNGCPNRCGSDDVVFFRSDEV